MSALQRLGRARAVMVTATAARATLWAAALASLAAAAALAAGAAGAVVGWAAAGAAATGLALSSWRGRAVRSGGEVALWLEGRHPELGYALVTLADPRFAGDPAPLERAVAGSRWGRSLRRALLRGLAPPALALAAGLVLLLLVVPPAGEAAAGPLGRGRAATGVGAEGARVLGPVRVRIEPPAYTGAPARELDDPASVDGLVGSTVRIRGAGAPPSAASLRDVALPVLLDESGWRLELTMPERPAALRLEAPAGGGRLLALEPVPDSLPVVSLLLPAADTVMPAPAGRLELRAEARDDWGLDAVWLEYIVSSGEGEIFEFRSGSLAARPAGGRRTAGVAADLSLDSLRLRHGDVVHVRAAARDRNDATGPGVGVSETRSLRVARRGEYDEVAVDAAPPPDAEGALLSQRMLIRLAEALQERRGSLARAAVIEESRRIAIDQVRLRRQVGDVIFMRLGDGEGAEHSHGADGHVHFHGDGHDHAGEELPTAEELLRRAEAAAGLGVEHYVHSHGGESPVVALNRPLLEAYGAMWSAAGELEIGEPDAALPHMYAALAAIQRAREAERRYLRGAMPLVIVDLARVRLSGARDRVAPSARSPHAELDGAVRRRLARFEAGVERLARDPAAAVDSLTLLRLELLTEARAAAEPLADAIDALRRGDDATAALARARRAIAGAPAPRPGLPRWGGATSYQLPATNHRAPITDDHATAIPLIADS